MVGFDTSDDAAVYKLSDKLAMINTIDFITPPVDDPYWFGLISAANSISDIYSMGGRPLTALNVVMFPARHLDMGVLKQILKGGHDKTVEAGAGLVGGHSVDDEEPKYGLSVSGIVHPDRIITNTGACAGDALILTKPLGSGVLFNAVRAGKYSFSDLEKETLPIIAALNKKAMEIALDFDLHACTDVTGFGIAGHAFEIASASRKKITLHYKNLWFYAGALDMYKKGQTTGSNTPNRQMTKERLTIQTPLAKAEEELLFDPQTSGGLLLSVPESEAAGLVDLLYNAGITSAAVIGRVSDGPAGVDVI